MCLSVVALVVVLLFIVLGYRFNRSDGRIEQGGLLQFDSRPGGAGVAIDGMALSARTASKATTGAGEHFITMERNGYQKWQKSVTVAPGAVVWLDYTRLIPDELKTENVASFSKIAASLASFDGKWMAIKEDIATPAIGLVDISREAIRQTTLELPTGSYTAPAAGKGQSFALETWDSTNKYLLVKHVYNDAQMEWLVVNTENAAQTVNLTKLLNVPMTQVLFSGINTNTLFVQVGTDVRKVDIAAATLSRPLVSNVAEFSVYDRSTIVYTTVSEAGIRVAGYYEDGAEKPHVLRTFTDDGRTPLKVALGKYFNESYVAIAYGERVDIYKGKLPTTGNDVSSMTAERDFTQMGGTQYIDIRNNGRFVAAQNGAEFQVYDIELKQLSKTTLKNALSTEAKLKWLDNYHAWSDAGSTLRLYEFDGANQHDIMSVIPGQSATLALDGTFLYGFTTATDGTYHLSRTRLILP
jgi:hypothetical protein